MNLHRLRILLTYHRPTNFKHMTSFLQYYLLCCILSSLFVFRSRGSRSLYPTLFQTFGRPRPLCELTSFFRDFHVAFFHSFLYIFFPLPRNLGVVSPLVFYLTEEVRPRLFFALTLPSLSFWNAQVRLPYSHQNDSYTVSPPLLTATMDHPYGCSRSPSFDSQCLSRSLCP